VVGCDPVVSPATSDPCKRFSTDATGKIGRVCFFCRMRSEKNRSASPSMRLFQPASDSLCVRCLKRDKPQTGFIPMQQSTDNWPGQSEPQ